MLVLVLVLMLLLLLLLLLLSQPGNMNTRSLNLKP
jgi:hypothetical protein